MLLRRLLLLVCSVYDWSLREYGAAREMAPGNAEMIFWTAVSLVNAGRVEDALPLLRDAFKDDKGDWRATLRRLPASGLLPDDPALMARLLGEAPPR